MRFPACLLLAVVGCHASQSAIPSFDGIAYQVSPDNGLSRLSVRMRIPHDKGPVQVQIPNWSPGGYARQDFYNGVQGFRAVSLNNGADEKVTQNENTWTIQGGDGPIEIQYTVPTLYGNDGENVIYAGAATYMYVVGKKEEPCRLRLDLPNGWKAYTGLDQGGGEFDYVAPNYDVLADCPVSLGSDLVVRTYTTRSVPHYIVASGGGRKNLDLERLEDACKHVSEMESDFFGGLPFKKYVWHFGVYEAQDGADGVEHRNSTHMTLSSGAGPGAMIVLSHEYFHAWNVKRIRSKVLGPFDYNAIPKTGALWWLEGVTEYYTHTLIHRYDWPELNLMSAIGYFTRNLRANPARFEVSPYDSSYRVGEAGGGSGSYNGYRVDYYDLGFLAGLCFDIEIRAQTGGKKSLDDVEMALWQQCKDDQPGFEEGDIRRHLVEVGGRALGTLYDDIILKPTDMPVKTQLAKVGLKLGQVDVSIVDPGFAWVPDAEHKAIKVTAVHGDAGQMLQAGDLITAVNGALLSGTNQTLRRAADDLIQNAKAGGGMALFVFRGGATTNVTVTPKVIGRKVFKAYVDPDASPEARKLREQWLAKKAI